MGAIGAWLARTRSITPHRHTFFSRCGRLRPINAFRMVAHMFIYPVLMLALPIYLNWASFDSKFALVAYRVGLLAIYLAITGVCLGIFVLVRQPPVTHHPPGAHRACLVSPSLPGCLCVAVHPPARVRGAGRQQGRRRRTGGS